jgi:hypothetical protein
MQTIDGIPVEYGMMAVQTKDGKIVGESENGSLKLKNLEKSAKISESIALQNAMAFVGAESYKWQNKEEKNLLKKNLMMPMLLLLLKVK